jgi:hypothetical protein
MASLEAYYHEYNHVHYEYELPSSSRSLRSSDPGRLTSRRLTRPPPRTPESAWTERKNCRQSPPDRSSLLPPLPLRLGPACVHLGPPPRWASPARVGTLRGDRHDDPVRSLRYRSPSRRRGSTIGTATARRPSTVFVVVRDPEQARPNEPVVYPVRKVDEGRRVDLTPPPLESHPPGGRLAYRGQEQPIATRAARRRTTENAIVIVAAVREDRQRREFGRRRSSSLKV